MQIFISLVISEASEEGVRTTVATHPDIIRQDLIEFYIDALLDGGLPEGAPTPNAKTNTVEIADMIVRWMGQSVVLQESWLINPCQQVAA